MSAEGVQQPYRVTEDPERTSFIELLQSRRSIRGGFIDVPIDQDLIEEIVTSGLSAPSSKNAQPWRIHALAQGGRLSGIADAVQYARDASRYVPINPATGQPREWSSTVVESAQVLREVGVGLFIENRGAFSGGKHAVANAAESVRSTAVTGYSYEMVGIGAMIQNMWLNAEARGLRGVFMGDVAVAERQIQEELGFNGDLVGVLALGYTDQQPFDRKLKTGTVVYHPAQKGEDVDVSE